MLATGHKRVVVTQKTLHRMYTNTDNYSLFTTVAEHNPNKNYTTVKAFRGRQTVKSTGLNIKHSLPQPRTA